MLLPQAMVEYRAKKGMSINAFASELHMSPNTIWRIEHGGPCHAVTAAKIRMHIDRA